MIADHSSISFAVVFMCCTSFCFAQNSATSAPSLHGATAAAETCSRPVAVQDPAQQAKAAGELARARRLTSEGHLAEAETALEQSLSLWTTADAWYELGVVRFGRAQARCSLQAFTAAAALQAPRGEDLRFVALDYVLLDDAEDAEKWLRVAVRMEPSNAEAWYDLGRTLFSEKRYPEAADAFTHSVSLHPGQIRATTYLGLIAETNNDPRRAESEYRQAIGEESGAAKPFALPYRSLGALLRDQGRLEEAVPLLLQAVALAPNDPITHAELGTCFVKQRNWNAAREEFATAIRLHPSRPAWHFQLGRVYQALGMKEQAGAEFATAKSQIDVAPQEAPDQ